MDLVEIKLNEMLKKNKEIELGNIYSYINDSLIDLYFLKNEDLNLSDDQRKALQLRIDNILTLFLKYLKRIEDGNQALNPEYKLDLFK